MNTGPVQLLPRLIRLRNAPFYLGMDRHRFNAEVRPYLSEVPIGEQGIAFDRLDLDAWADQYKFRNGRRPTKEPEDDICQNVTKCRDFASKTKSGTSKNAVSTAPPAGSVKARKHLAALRQKGS